MEYVKLAWAIDMSKFSRVAISRNTQAHYRGNCRWGKGRWLARSVAGVAGTRAAAMGRRVAVGSSAPLGLGFAWGLR